MAGLSRVLLLFLLNTIEVPLGDGYPSYFPNDIIQNGIGEGGIFPVDYNEEIIRTLTSDTVPYSHNVPSCHEAFYFTYDYDFFGSVWQGVKGHVAVANGEAVFQGQGSLILPYFACNDLLPRYSMRFTISPEYTQYEMAVLGNSLNPSIASILVSVSAYNLKLVVKPRPTLDEPPIAIAERCDWQMVNEGQSAAHYPPYSPAVTLKMPLQAGYNTVTLGQEGGQIFLNVNGYSTSAHGHLPTLTREPLYIGAGADPHTGQVLPLYRGTFDSFVFEKCPTKIFLPSTSTKH